MRPLILNHQWIDDSFYEKGSFIVRDQGRSVMLLKGGVFESEENPSSEGCATIFCKNFYDDQILYHHSDQCLKISLEELRTYISESVEEKTIVEAGNDDHLFAEDFVDLKKMVPKDIKKAVLISRQGYRSEDSRNLMRHLFAKALSMKQGRAYGFWHRDHGIVGCTPEVLFEVNQGKLMTEALAGTAKVGEEAELLSSLKDREEHEIVVHDLSEKLFSVKLFPRVGNTETSPFSSMIHLRTKIEADHRPDVSALTLSKLLSPSAALGGYPKEASKKFLLNTRYHHLYPTRFFGSVIGTEYGDPLGLVMIRNVQWDGDLFYIESGVGIVEASDLQKELEELKLKRKVIKDHYL